MYKFRPVLCIVIAVGLMTALVVVMGGLIGVERQSNQPLLIKLSDFTTRESYLCQPVVLSENNMGSVALALHTKLEDQWTFLPIHFVTTLTYFASFRLYSTAPGSIYGHEIVDSVRNISRVASLFDDRFRASRMAQHVFASHALKSYNQLGITSPPELDEFQHLAMIHHASLSNPNASWVVVASARTIINHDELKRVLAKYNPDKKLFLGKFNYDPNSFERVSPDLNGVYALSHGSLAIFRQRLAKIHPTAALSLGEPVSRILARTAFYGSVEMKHDEFFAANHPIQEIPFTRQTFENKLVFAQTTDPGQINLLAIGGTYFDVYSSLFHEEEDFDQNEWDNYAADITTQAASFEECRGKCSKNQKCLSFRYNSGQNCGLGFSVRRGYPSSEYKSGWLIERLI